MIELAVSLRLVGVGGVELHSIFNPRRPPRTHLTNLKTRKINIWLFDAEIITWKL